MSLRHPLLLAVSQTCFTVGLFLRDFSVIWLMYLVSTEPGHKRKASDESEHERYMKRLAKLPCPSDLVRSWQQKSSADPLFLNHRPASSKGLPTELLHPIFGNFLDDCRNAVPTSEDYVFTKLVSEEMSAYYPSETARAQKFRELFKKHFTINLNCIEFDGSKTDGTWSPNAEADFVAMNAEIKKEPGAGNPHIQNVAYYKQYLSEHQNDFVEKIRLPCFLVQVDGPELNISTVIYGNKIIVDPYHFTLSLACSSTRLEDFARIFHALKNAFEALRTYYNGPPPEISPSQRQYPYPNSFRTTHGEIQFKYHTALNSHPFVCLVDVLGNQPDLPRRLVVKFTRQYPHAIHQACANLRIAPELYGFETLPGGWFMVIMTYMVDYSTLVEYAPNPLIKAEVKKAMGQLHLLGFVHGDLRDVNILVRRSDADSAVNIVFVDWDWAGKDGEVNYPLSINPDIPRHPEAKALKAIRIDHDEFMFQNLFSSCS